MKLPRLFHQVYAALLGYFWMPCPVCGKHMGGHEWKNDVFIEKDNGLGQAICNSCAKNAKIGFDNNVVVAIDPVTLQPYDTGWRTL